MMFKTRFVKWAGLAGMFLCVAACLAPPSFAGPPAGINIRGQLLDVQGQALPGVREFSVQFFDAAAGGTPLGDTITGQVEVSPEGLFNIPLVLPPQALLAPEAWYEVAVASGILPGPLTGADLFPNRVKLESVPFALEALDVTHVDVASIGSGLVQDGEFDFLSGVTSGIQDQLDAKANAADVYTIDEVDALQAGQDAVIADKVARTGDTMTGALTVNDSFVGIGQAAAPGAPADKLYNIGGTLYWNGQQVIAGGAAGFPWSAVTADTQMSKNNGYIANSANLLTLTLPLSGDISVGDTLRVAGLGAGGWKIAQNASQRILTGPMEIPDYSGPWTAREAEREWISIAASADDRVIVAAQYGGSGGGLYTSWDYGVTWTQRATGQWWYGLASSADGSTLVGVTGGYIYTSWDSGATWTKRGTNQNWGACAASADGTRMVATWDTDLYVSTDSGATWTGKAGGWNGWGQVAMSADGMTIACCATIDWGGGFYVLISHDCMETYTYIPGSGSVGVKYSDVALSADGTKVAACVYGGRIWTSADSGATWIARESVRNWSAIDMSADGTKLVAHDHIGYDYFSTDSGLTWTPGADARNIPTHGMVMSADGTRVACVQWEGNIYTLNTNGATVAQTPAGTAGYITGAADSAVELQYEGSNTFRVLTHEKARPYQTVTQPELALGLAAKANAGDVFTWNTAVGDTQMCYNNGYLATGSSLVTLTLPASSALNIGDTVRVSGLGTGGWKITQYPAQRILTGSTQTPDYSHAWTARMTDSNRFWNGVASSADGTKLVALEYGGFLYTSTDSGVTWTRRDGNPSWYGVASSVDGTKLVASAVGGHLYTSTDSGVTWTARDANRSWRCVASSADGTKLVACVYGGQIYTSTDSGVTWTPRDSNRQWLGVASSADGTKLVACVDNGQLYTSTDSGVTWTPRDSNRFWNGVASSADGTKLVALEYGGFLYTSTDSGVMWTRRDGNPSWYGVASSVDGTKLVASAVGGQLYTSTDSGVTWTARDANRSWRCVASSADGTKLVAGVWNGQIYTYSAVKASTTAGTAGYLAGDTNTAVELQYTGNNTFVPLSHEGALLAN